MSSSSVPPSTVYIVDDDSATRKSLRWLVETLGVPVKTFPCAVDFLEAYDPAQPGCLVLDVMMPGMSGLDLLAELRARNIDIPVIILTGYADVPSAVRAFKKGVYEFLEKPLNDSVLLERIQEALALDSRRRRERVGHDEIREKMTRLTPREHEVLELVVDGLSSKQIAARLNVSFKTVEAHRAKIMKKMEAESVAQLVRMVVSTRSAAERQKDARSEKPAHLRV